MVSQLFRHSARRNGWAGGVGIVSVLVSFLGVLWWLDGVGVEDEGAYEDEAAIGLRHCGGLV